MKAPTPPSPGDSAQTSKQLSIYRQILADPRSVPVAELSGVARMSAVLARNFYWGRTHGWSNLLEEHDLDLVHRIPRDFQKWKWRRSHRVIGRATPIFLVGAQRSGTNMVTHGLAYSPEFEIYNEGNRRAFSNYRLKSLDHVSVLIQRSRHPFVLFKPLNDTHRVLELLDDLSSSVRPKVLWVYREVTGRTKSAVAKFGDSNLRVLRRFAEDDGYVHWQLGGSEGLSDASRRIIQRYDVASLTPADGSALFWLIRNRLFFELGLDKRSDVMLVSYDRFISDPELTMNGVCRFLGLSFDAKYIDHVGVRRTQSDGPKINDELLKECRDLEARLAGFTSAQATRPG